MEKTLTNPSKRQLEELANSGTEHLIIKDCKLIFDTSPFDIIPSLNYLEIIDLNCMESQKSLEQSEFCSDIIVTPNDGKRVIGLLITKNLIGNRTQKIILRYSNPNSLPYFHDFKYMKALKIKGFQIQAGLFKRFSNSNVEDLVIENLWEKPGLKNLEAFSNLEKLSIDHCLNMKYIDVKSNMKIKILEMSAVQISDLSFISKLENLEVLHLEAIIIKKIPPLNLFESLRVIFIKRCKGVDIQYLVDSVNPDCFIRMT